MSRVIEENGGGTGRTTPAQIAEETTENPSITKRTQFGRPTMVPQEGGIGLCIVSAANRIVDGRSSMNERNSENTPVTASFAV